MQNISDSFKLNNGYHIPCVGVGTWQIPDGELVKNTVKNAIEVGYRHIDTAAVYNNELGVGQAIRETGVSRKELFITSKIKLQNKRNGYDQAMFSFENTMRDLKLDYLDLYLIHWPASSNNFDNWVEMNKSTWKALIDLYKAERVRSIGVSNFLSHHLVGLMEMEVLPMVNQIEYHPGQMQEEVVSYCVAHNILIEAWSPFGSGRILQNIELQSIAKKYNKSVAQLCIRWCLQNGAIPLPKTVTLTRLKENAEIFDFDISDEDMIRINKMGYCGGSGLHPDEVSL